MPFTVDQLLLTDEREAQLIAALANTGETDPLGRCINEAMADVARFTRGYVIDQTSLDGWTRSLALWKAYSVIEGGVPDEIEKANKAALDELTAIAAGKRPNLARIDDGAAQSTSTGGWGSDCKICT